MKRIPLLYIIALLVLGACGREEEVPVTGRADENAPERVPSGFTVSLPQPGSRTAVNMATGIITWVTDDPILVSSGNASVVMYVDEGGSTTAGLYCEGETLEGSDFYAVYPAENGAAAGGVFSSAIPSVQNYEKGGFSTQTFPMVAIADSRRNFAFRNAASLLRLDFSGSLFEGVNISSLTLTADEYLAGAISVSYSLGSEPVVDITEGVKSVTVNGPSEGIPFGEPVYVAVAPGSYHNVHIRISFKNGLNYECDVDGAVSVDRSAYRIVPVVVEDKYIDLSDPESANCYLITAPGYYKFRADVRGNGVATSAGLPASAEGIAGIRIYHKDGSNFIDGSLALIGNYIYFSTLEDPAEDNSLPRGTVLISAFGSTEQEGEQARAIWSWQIWSNGRVKDVALSDGTVWLNMNLGAHQVGFNANGYNGYYYQWGRKDPFLQKYTTDTKAATLAPFVSHASDIDGSLENAIANPHIFYGGYHPSWTSDITEDWSTYEDSVKVYDWWNKDLAADAQTAAEEGKTMFDPCPPGYHVPVYSDIVSLLGLAQKSGRAVANAWWVEDVLYFPYTSYRYISLNTAAWQSGSNPTALIPCSVPTETGDAHHRRYAVLRLTRDGSAVVDNGTPRSYGVTVRCIKDGTGAPAQPDGSHLDGTIEDMTPEDWN